MYHLHSTRYLWSQAADRWCCCCCCGSGDRDRDFCIYKNLFLAVVWIVLVSVSPIFYFDPRSAGQVSFPDGWTSFVFWLGYTNSSINPFIYAVKFKEFRPAFRDSLRWILCRSGTSRPDAPRWTSTNTNINFKVKYFLLFGAKYFLSTPVNIFVLSKRSGRR